MSAQELVCDFLKYLLDKHCTGSGFDGSWKVSSLKNGSFLAEIDYHNLNPNGYYDNWHTIKAFINNDLELVKCQYKADRNTRRKYIENESYFEETIANALESVRKDFQDYMTNYRYSPD